MFPNKPRQVPPVRIVIQSPALTRDEVTPSALVLTLDTTDGQVRVFEQHVDRAHLAGFVEVAIRYAILHGVMQDVFAGLVSQATNGSFTTHLPPAQEPPAGDDPLDVLRRGG